ncbi:MAG: YhdP family protein [Thiobacillaceae bacterium]
MLLLNRLLRWGGVILLLAMVGAGTLLAYLYVVVLPHIADYRSTLESLLSSATGFQVKLDEVGGEWGGARPWFILKGVTLYDRESKPVLHFDRLEGKFGWRSVFTLEPRFHSLNVEGSLLAIRRTEQGNYQVGGIAIDPQSPRHDFSDWLLKQGEVTLDGLTLAWIDDFRHAPPLVLSNLRVDLNNLGPLHKLLVSATPPEGLASSFALDAQLIGRQISKFEDWSGTLEGIFRNLRIESLSPWVDLSYVKSGRGGAVLIAQLQKGRIVSVDARLNMVGVTAQSDKQSAPMRLQKLVGLIGWQSNNNGQIVKMGGLSFQPESSPLVGPINGQFGWSASGYQVAVDEFELSTLKRVIPFIPLKVDLRDRLSALQAKGHFDHLQASWQKPARQGARASFSVSGQFRQLGWEAVDKWPGAKGLSGSVDGTQDQGEFTLDLKSGQVSLPGVFRDKTIDWNRVEAEGGWRWKNEGYELRLSNVVMENADLAGSMAGTYLIGNGRPDKLDLSGRLERALGPSVYKYIPSVANDNTYNWLKQGIVAGEASQATFVLRGEPRYFPFRNDAGGLFHIDALANGVVLHYAADWPTIDAIDGELRFRGGQIEILSDQARIFSVQLRGVHAVVPDFTSTEPVLDVKGEANGPLSDFVRFANFSPVSDRIDNLTDEMSGSGDMALALNIKVPLRHSLDTTIAGRLSFNNDTVFPGPDMPRLEQVRGQLDFTEQKVSADRISAHVLGGPAVITARSQDSKAHVFGQGVFTATALETWLGKPVSHLLTGQAGWKGEITLGQGPASVKAESSLVGLESKLPAPLAKRANQSALLKLERQPLKDGSVWSSASYANKVNGVWLSQPGPSGLKFDRGEIRFGEKAQLPWQPGLLISGYVRDFDLGRWLDLMPAGGEEQSSLLSGINLTFASLDFLGRRFTDINLDGKLKGGILKINVSGQGVEGSVAYRKALDGSIARVSGVFKQVVIPAPMGGEPAGENAHRLGTSDFPSMDLSVDDLRMEDMHLGHLDALAHGGQQGLTIDRLELVNPDSLVSMRGVWKDVGQGETRVTLAADIKDAGKMLARYGYPDSVKRGKGSVSGEVTWQGSPADFAFRTLTGTLNFKAQNGQFLRVDPGAAKLLGIISLQSIPRRLNLDFRDVFSGGFAFDEISATLRIVAGNVYSDDFRMKGPAASVRMSGVARLADETVQLRVKVSPKLSESVAVAGALIGGPLAGLGALAVQKVLKDPLEEATSFEYLVSGPWVEPDVTKLSKTRSAKGKESDG